MEILGVERLDTKKRRARRGAGDPAKTVADKAGFAGSSATAGAADERLLEEVLGTKYMAAKAVIGGEDRGPALGSPREMPEDVQPAGEKVYYRGFHDTQNKGLITGAADHVPEDERKLPPQDKLEQRL